MASLMLYENLLYTDQKYCNQYYMLKPNTLNSMFPHGTAVRKAFWPILISELSVNWELPQIPTSWSGFISSAFRSRSQLETLKKTISKSKEMVLVRVSDPAKYEVFKISI